MGGDDRKKFGSDKPAATAAKGEKKPKEEYVVIIKNVENSLALIHQHALPQFLCLKKHEAAKKVVSEETEDGDDDVAVVVNSEVGYGVSCRNETRSGQVDFTTDNIVECFAAPGTTRGVKAPEEKSTGDKRKRILGSDDDEEDVAAAAPGKPNAPFANLHEVASKFNGKQYFGQKIKATVLNQADGKKDDAAGVVTQKSLMSVQATTSKPCTPTQFGKLLEGIPGFNTAWKLRAQAFRAVFLSKKHLFAAKSLLDEFEAEGGVRISLVLPDTLSSEFQEFVENQEKTQQHV